MVTIRMIVDRIKELLYQQYPSCTFYTQTMPENAVKPSFYLYIYTDRSEDGNRLLTYETTSIGISYFPPDTGEIPEDLQALNVYDFMKGVFRKGSFQVDDRALKVILLRGGTEGTETYLIVKMVYEEERPLEATAYDSIGEIRKSVNLGG